jgi:ribonuclease VapC
MATPGTTLSKTCSKQLEQTSCHLTMCRLASPASFVAYGKGINPASKLNLCDCAAYALAKVFGAPLLFKGDDFRATDIASAV